MKIIATKGENIYLLVKEDVNKKKKKTKGRVLDLNAQKLYPWFYANSIISRGFWEPYEGNQDILDGLLDQVKIIDKDMTLE